ncbi:dTDP-4-dehydrorhamnose 3,5-epimerase [Nonlabens agnitus]|uniref:dTDP-4-dehydrorhamnose 3,5-epimerase n=1 Tax=Nonlabens agnitus TaxID=870484 RepID=A0A2S9WTZ4_9FLAO|nr:dTDP-4-dehydrorhamnose 3,5-epimerase [Nonlabens agnitus]PRP66929.1 dTDP-4-dehydrorhamnose 3,5-epimerase [Nonlabens agnitus]
MIVTETYLNGCFIIEPQIHKDERGYFMESFNKKKFEAGIGREVSFVQDNEARSSYGVIRGLHFQKEPYAQAKLVRVIDGTVLDVAVDLRKESPTYGKHFSIELSAENKKQLFVPRGFAHGYSVLSETALFSYKCDNLYHKESEDGILFDDVHLNIDWKIDKEYQIISEKDRMQQSFSEFEVESLASNSIKQES